MVYFSSFTSSWAPCYIEHPLLSNFKYLSFMFEFWRIFFSLLLCFWLFFTLLQLCVSSQCYSTFAKLKLRLTGHFYVKTPSRCGLCLLSVRHSQGSSSPFSTVRASSGLIREAMLHFSYKKRDYFLFLFLLVLTRPFVKTNLFLSFRNLWWMEKNLKERSVRGLQLPLTTLFSPDHTIGKSLSSSIALFWFLFFLPFLNEYCIMSLCLLCIPFSPPLPSYEFLSIYWLMLNKLRGPTVNLTKCL